MDRAEIEKLFEHWERGDWRHGLPLLAPDIRFTAAQPEGQIEKRGPDGVVEFMRGFLPAWDLYTVELDSLEEHGPGIWLAVGKQRGKGKGSGMDIDAPLFAVIAAPGSAITHLEFHFEREPAEATLAGLGD